MLCTKEYEIRLYDSDGQSKSISYMLSANSEYNNSILARVCNAVILKELIRMFTGNSIRELLKYVDIYFNQITINNLDIIDVFTDNETWIDTISEFNFIDGKGVKKTLNDVVVQKTLVDSYNRTTVYQFATGKTKKAVIFRKVQSAKGKNQEDYIYIESRNDFTCYFKCSEWFDLSIFVETIIKKGTIII